MNESKTLRRLFALAFAVFAACASPPPPESAAPAPPAAPVPAPLLPAGEPLLSNEPIQPISAPFPMPALERPRFPPGVWDVRAFGAVSDGVTKNTEAFRKAIAAAVAKGGGTVLVPAGRWVTGPIHLASNVNLHVAEGAEILFSQDFADYLPVVFSRWEGLELMNYSPLVYAKDCENVAITGKGKLDGRGQAWWPWKKTQQGAAKRLYDMASAGTPPEKRVFGSEGDLRPSFIQTVGCKNVLVEGVTITSGPMWTIHPVYSENVIVRRVTVLTDGPNNDGLNPDSSKNVLVEDSFFSTGDDCVVIKSGLNEDGWRVGRPSENIVVRRLRGQRGHGGVVIGSEMSGGVRNVFVDDCEFVGTDRGLRIKSMRGRGGVVENVYYQNVKHLDLRLLDVEMTTFYASSTLVPLTQKPPTIRNVHVKNVTGNGGKTAAEIVGLPELPIEDVTFDDVSIASETGVRCTDAENVRFTNTKIAPKTGSAFRLENARKVTLERSCAGPVNQCVELAGDRTADVRVDGAAFGTKPTAAAPPAKKPIPRAASSAASAAPPP
ncbi:MAG TPA: glycoside hydrolase family 28 protein [Polyangiaceae bacterium]